MRVHFSTNIGVAAVVFAMLAVTSAFGNYNFTTLVGPDFGVFDDPAIDHGLAAFGANFGIYSANGGPLTTIVQSGDPAPSGTFHFLNNGGIDNGTVAFVSSYDGGKGIFTGNGGLVTTVAKTGDPAPSGTFTNFDPPFISGGSVAFSAQFNNNSQGIFLASGGSLTTVVKTGDAAPSGQFFGFGSRPAMSAGTIVFSADYTGAGTGIITSSGGTLTELVKAGDPAPSGTFYAFGDPAVSDGTVAFHGSYNNGDGIFTASGSAIRTIAKVGDPAPVGTFTSFFVLDPAISHGTVAFYGEFGNGDEGIFTSTGGALTTVIKTGDPLFGSTVNGLSFSGLGLDRDGSGKLAFHYSLADDYNGVALAVPVIPGDYDGNGSVGPEDFNLWKSTFGSTTNLAADGNGNHIIDAGDFTVWRDHLGSNVGAGSSSALSVPEPPCWTIFLVGVIAIGLRRRDRFTFFTESEDGNGC
jgi:hypothetical protein